VQTQQRVKNLTYRRRNAGHIAYTQKSEVSYQLSEVWGLKYEVWGLKYEAKSIPILYTLYSLLKIGYQLSVICYQLSVVWGMKSEVWSMKHEKSSKSQLALNSLCSWFLVLGSIFSCLRYEVWGLKHEAESIPILYTLYSLLHAVTKMNFHLHFIVYPTIFAFHFKRSFFLNLIAR
jgi:hypothetical protein